MKMDDEVVMEWSTSQRDWLVIPTVTVLEGLLVIVLTLVSIGSQNYLQLPSNWTQRHKNDIHQFIQLWGSRYQIQKNPLKDGWSHVCVCGMVVNRNSPDLDCLLKQPHTPSQVCRRSTATWWATVLHKKDTTQPHMLQGF